MLTIVLITHILITCGFFTYVSYRNANNLIPLVDTMMWAHKVTKSNLNGFDYTMDIIFSIIFWPSIVFIICGKFIYEASLYEKFLQLLKKKEKLVPEIDEAKSNYRNTVYK
jgi:hypothetical protein